MKTASDKWLSSFRQKVGIKDKLFSEKDGLFNLV